MTEHLLLREILAALEHQRQTNARFYGEIMAQIDDLNSTMDTITTEVGKIGTDVQTLVTELQTANTNPAVDLTGVIQKAQAIQTKLQGIDSLVPATPVATETPVTPVQSAS